GCDQDREGRDELTLRVPFRNSVAALRASSSDLTCHDSERLAHLDASSSPLRNPRSARLPGSSPVAGTGAANPRARRFVMRRFGILGLLIGVVIAATAFAGVRAHAEGSSYFTPGNLLVSRSVYDDNPNNVQVGMTLPPGCTNGCGAAIAD